MDISLTLPRIKALLIIFSLLAILAIPFAQAADDKLPNEEPGPSLDDEQNWWADWAGDLNKNKIDDNLEWFIHEENLGPMDEVPIIVDYDHKPSELEGKRLAEFGWNVEYVCRYIDSIAVEIPVSALGTITLWEDVVMVEWAPDMQFSLSSAMPSINVPAVWQNLGIDGEGVTIAIIDTGIDDEHAGLDDLDDDPETDDPKVIAFYDALKDPLNDDGTKEPYDNNGHGTHCAGTAAGTGANNFNHVGVAPKAYLVGVKIGDGSIPYNTALDGVEWAIANKEKFGIDILSNSWGLVIGGPNGHNGQSSISRLMDEAVDAGLVVFVAAGNTAISLTVLAPGDAEKVITVGSVNDNHVLSSFSSQGPTSDGRIKPDVCAIGEGVTSPDANSGAGYGGFSGTSAACPMAAGVAALVLQANPYLTPDNVKQIFHETSEHNTDARFPVSPNNGYGWGVVDAYGATKRAWDLNQTFLSAPPVVHEGDLVHFNSNTTYTRTEFTYKGQDGIRIMGDDTVVFQISIPDNWSIPTNITVVSEGDLGVDSFFSVPRLEDNMWVIEAEFHYNVDVNETKEATPRVLFDSTTPDVEKDTTYTLFSNITLNGMNATHAVRSITVDAQEPPFVAIENPDDGETVNNIFTVIGTAYDPDIGDDVERVEIKINDDPWEITQGTTNWQYEWNTLELNNGQYSISAMAFDGEENSTLHTIVVNVDNNNIQPIAIIDTLSPNPANEGEEVSFSGYGNDDDGFIVEYEWSSNIDGFFSDTNAFSYSGLSIGIHEISFRVKDNDGTWSVKALVDLRINQIPLAYIDSVAPNPANEGDTVTFIGHGGDDRNIVAYNWRSSIDGFLSDLASFSTSSLTPGDHEIYLRVQDDDGVWSEEVMQNIRINGIPLAYIDSITPNPANEGDEVSFAGHGDDDVGVVAYEWSSDLDGFLSGAGSFPTSDLSVGDHIISFRVMDDENVWSDLVFSDLRINPVPSAFIDSMNPNPANEGDEVSFAGHGEDIGEIVAYSWNSDIDGFLSDLSSFSTPILTPGIHTIFFQVQNDNGVWSEEATADLRVNGPPAAFIDSIDPNPAVQGEEVHFQGHGVDESGIINHSWSSSIDGVLGDTSSIITSQLSLGDHTISFKVQDSDNVWSEEVTQSLRVHKRPIAIIDSISPHPANEGDEVSFEGHGFDDGAIIAYEWYSDIDGFLSDSDSFVSSTLSIGEHEISFLVMDDDGAASDAVIYSIGINQIPVAYIDSVSPNPAIEGESITFAGHGTDEGEIMDYDWRSSIDDFLSVSDSFSTALSAGDHVIYFKVKDDDGVWSEEVFLALRINGIPTAIIDSVSPNRANEGETISLVGHGSDDGSIVAYSWSSNIDGYISDDDSFSTSSLSVGDHIISFMVEDDEGAWSVEVLFFLHINGIPAANIDSVSPNPANEGESITFTGHGTDDGDIVGYTWLSHRDGILSVSASFSTSSLSTGDHIIYFKVKDSNDVWSDEVTTGLRVNQIPKALIDSITPNPANEFDTITFIGHGTDDGVIMEYNWRSSLDGFLSGQKEFDTELSAGEHKIYLSVKDDLGVWSNEVVKALHINEIPKAKIDYITPNPAKEGDIIEFLGHGTDDGTVTAYEWISSIDGKLGTESSLSLSYLSAGTHVIYFKVMDDDGIWSLEATKSLLVEIRINQIPTVHFISPVQGDVVKDVIVIQAQADDADGQVEKIEIRVDDADWFQISDSSYAYYSLKTKGIGSGEHVLYVRAFDGEQYSAEELIIIEVHPESEENPFFGEGGLLWISLVVVIILISLILLLYWLFAGRKRRI